MTASFHPSPSFMLSLINHKSLLFTKVYILETTLVVQWLPLTTQGLLVQPLAGEQRSHMTTGQNARTKNRSNIAANSIKIILKISIHHLFLLDTWPLSQLSPLYLSPGTLNALEVSSPPPGGPNALSHLHHLQSHLHPLRCLQQNLTNFHKDFGVLQIINLQQLLFASWIKLRHFLSDLAQLHPYPPTFLMLP